MQFRLLGPLQVLDDQDRPLVVAGPRVRALLAVLLLEVNQVVPSDRLADQLWDGDPPAAWRPSLHFLVHKLRGILGDARHTLATREPGYVLELRPEELDLTRFGDQVSQARIAWAAGRLEEASSRFETALGLWRGRALAGFEEMGFAQLAISRLEEARLGALVDRIEVALALGRHTPLLGELDALTRAHPFQEGLHAQRILALYRAGRLSDALTAYRQTRDLLRSELAIEPGQRLQDLERAILNRDPALDPPAPATTRADSVPAPDSAATRPPPAPPREERKTVTVMTVLAGEPGRADVDPEDARASSAAMLAAIERVVGRFGGSVQASVGGRVLGVFGVPVAHDDDPERAVRAALELARSNPGARIGIESGEALVDVIPGAGRRSPVGAVVDVAAGLAATAPLGRVAVGAGTWQATSAEIEYEPATGTTDGRLAVMARARTGTSWTAGRTAAPLVERAFELSILRNALGRVRSHSEPQLVTLVGAPGIGKSRLIAELAELVDADTDLIAWRQGRSLPYGDGVTFWALGEIVKAQAGILDTDAEQVAEAKLNRAAIEALDDAEEAAWVTRHLRPLVQVVPDAQISEDVQEAFAAWRRFLEAISARRPLVAVFEDVQWANDALLDFIDELVDRVGTVPLLVVCSTRTELLARRPGWGGGKPNQTTISLLPLTVGGIKALVSALLGYASLPEATLAALIQASGGNPLFVEEYVRMLDDKGMLAGGLDGRRAGQLPMPDSVRRLITARLDTLAPADKALLQAAAVLGQVGWPGGLAAVSGCDPATVEGWLTEVERRDLLRRGRPSSVAGETEFAFRHALVRDVAYAQLPRVVRAERHTRAAEWLAGLGTDRAEQVAHHWRQALALSTAAGHSSPELSERARLALRTAGDRALALTAHARAAGFYAAALDLWPDEEPGRADLLLRLGEALFYGHRTGNDVLEAARDALLARGDRSRAAEAEMMLAYLAWWQGRVEDRDRHGTAAFSLVVDQPESSAKAYVLKGVAESLMLNDQPEDAVTVAREAVRSAEIAGHAEYLCQTLVSLGMARVRSGDRGGLEDVARAVAVVEDARSSITTTICINLAITQSWAGDMWAAADAMARSVPAAERFGQRALYRAWDLGIRAACYYLVGRWDEALELADELLAGEPDYLEPTCWLVRGRIMLGRGRLQEAVEASERGLAAARTGIDTAVLQPALAFRCRVLLQLGRKDDATPLVQELVSRLGGRFIHPDAGTDLAAVLATFGHGVKELDAWRIVPYRWLQALRAMLAGNHSRAAGLYREIGCPPDEARARLGLAAELRAAGHHEEAAREAAEAERLWSAMGATAYAAEAASISMSAPSSG
jgi:DNA-binding SARP family transcriptional activator